MILDCLKSIFIRKYNGYKVYIHNMAKFDIIFLLKYIVKIASLQPVIHNGRIISLLINFGKDNKYKIEFKDSYLLLLSSLAKLTKGFGVDTLKSIFPFLFVNENNMDYIGPVPDFKFFDSKISQKEYNNYKTKFYNNWNLRNELINYLKSDLKSLYQVVMKFNRDIFNIEKIDMTKLPTNSAISFKIFRTNYLNDIKLPIIKGNIHKEIRNAYYGGVVEVFKNEGYNLKYYDVTSLYPFAMLNDMPTGDMLFSTDPDLNNYFGIVFIEVNTFNLNSNYLNFPLLLHKIDGRMYNPLGKWTGWYFSEEAKLAKSYGYNIKVLYGYKFDKSENIFNSFITNYFNIKAGLSNINMDRTTAKLLINSLYGRLGMKPYQDIIEIVDSNKAKDILSKYNVKEQYNLTDKLEFIRYENTPISGFEELYGKDEYLNFMLDCDSKNISVNQSLPSAIAITAYARMYMFKIIYRLIDLGIEIYYMDTDSIVVNKAIPEDLIGNLLGLFKLEHEIEHAYFINPKLYALKNSNGKLIGVYTHNFSRLCVSTHHLSRFFHEV